MPRASIIFATFAHAMTSTSPNASRTGDRSASSVGDIVIGVARDSSAIVLARLAAESAAVTLRAHVSRRGPAAAKLTPGASLPTTWRSAGWAAP
jgi:hypothetical protein